MNPMLKRNQMPRSRQTGIQTRILMRHSSSFNEPSLHCFNHAIFFRNLLSCCHGWRHQCRVKLCSCAHLVFIETRRSAISRGPTHQYLWILTAGACLAGCATTVPTGRIGVEWTPLRGTTDKTLGEGMHVVSPFALVYKIDLREQEREDSLDVLANNGLDIKLTASILYQPIPSEVYQLMTQTGEHYYATLIGPYVRSSARKVVGRYSPEEIYSTKREQIEREIREAVEQKLSGQHVHVNAVLIREVHLPP